MNVQFTNSQEKNEYLQLTKTILPNSVINLINSTGYKIYLLNEYDNPKTHLQKIYPFHEDEYCNKMYGFTFDLAGGWHDPDNKDICITRAYKEYILTALLHEFGHAVDISLNNRNINVHHLFNKTPAVSEYAKINSSEYWAESFRYWYNPNIDNNKYFVRSELTYILNNLENII